MGVKHTGVRVRLSQQGGYTHRLLLVVAALLEAAGVHGAAWLTTLPNSSGWQNTSGFSLIQDSVWFRLDHLRAAGALSLVFLSGAMCPVEIWRVWVRFLGGHGFLICFFGVQRAYQAAPPYYIRFS